MTSLTRARCVVMMAVFCCVVPRTAVIAQDAVRILSEAGAHLDRNEYAAAIALLASIPETVDPKLHIRKHLNIATALMNLGRHADALPHIEEARGLARQSDDIGGEASVEIAEGNYRRWARQRGSAIAAFERAVALATKSGDRGLIASAYGRLSVGYQDIEDWGRVMHFADKSLEFQDAPTVIHRFSHQIARGIAYFELYDRDAAEAAFKTALDLAIESGGKRNQGFAEGELGFVYWTFDKDARRALERYDRAVALTAAAGAPDSEATWRLNRANVYRDTGEHARAIAEYSGIVAFERAHKFERVTFAALKNIGQTYRLMGRFQDALATLGPLLRQKPGNYSQRHLWQAHMELASTYEALGRHDEADAQYRSMLAVLEEHLNTAIFDAFRTGSFAHTLSAYDPYERYIRFLTRDGKANHVAEAFRLSEKARARGFLEMLASVRSSLATHVPAALFEEESRIMRGISGVQQKLRAPGLSKETRETLLAELARHERDRDAFRLKLRIEHPSLAETRYPDVGGPPQVQPAIRPGETVVSFFLSEPESFRWAISRDHVRFDRIAGRARIEAQTARFRQVLRAPGDVAAARTEADALGTLLLSGLDIPQDTPLVIVPHGALHYVPFEALERAGQRLIERHAISYAPR